MLLFIAGVACGALLTAVVFTISERPAERFGALLGVLLRPTLPLWLWANASRRTSGFRLRTLDGARVNVVSDSNRWLGIFTAGRRFGFSPLLLAPAGLVRIMVRLFGRELGLAVDDRQPAWGHIVRALRVAPGLTLATRRRQDLAYLAEHGRYPIRDLTATPGDR